MMNITKQFEKITDNILWKKLRIELADVAASRLGLDACFEVDIKMHQSMYIPLGTNLSFSVNDVILNDPNTK